MRELEVGFNRITAAAEINRESEASGLNEISLNLLRDIEGLIGTLVFTLVGFAVLSVVSSGIFSQFFRFRVESTSRIMSLLQETKKLSQVASRISNLVVITDRAGVIEWVNNAFTQRSGYAQSDLIDQKMETWFSNTSILQHWKDAIHTGKSFMEETVAHTMSGDEYAVLVGVQPSYDDDGSLINYIIVMTDITEIKKVEHALRLSEKQLRNSLTQEREVNQIKSRFVSMTSHEFRTPIAIISAAAESLQDFYERMNEEQRKSRFDRIQDQVQHMTHMLDDILLINRIEEGKLSLNLEIFQLTQFMMSIVDEFRSAKTTQSLDVQLQEEELTIIADRTLIRQIVSNLVSNAIKYSPADSTISMTMQRDGEHAIITIRDQGIGIPLADQEHLFEAFHRADNVGKIKGTGLGLSIAKRAVDMHKGEITFASEEGKGTLFTVRLPLKQRMIGGVTKQLASASQGVMDTGSMPQ
jgi:PAS domain S-box-containing protein